MIVPYLCMMLIVPYEDLPIFFTVQLTRVPAYTLRLVKAQALSRKWDDGKKH